jgi:glyoxylase-like metal-dependent hydrolase (beta-lactamase superfamily II)
MNGFFSRRRLIGSGVRALTVGAIAPAAGAFARVAGETWVPAPPADGTMTVSLLGTGSPELRMNRFGASTLVEASGLRLVFDAGRGCALRLCQLSVPLGSIDRVFLTHFHSDHLNGLQDLWATSHIRAPYAGRARSRWAGRRRRRCAPTWRSGKPTRRSIPSRRRAKAANYLRTASSSSKAACG